jgi:hypothetical protein
MVSSAALNALFARVRVLEAKLKEPPGSGGGGCQCGGSLCGQQGSCTDDVLAKTIGMLKDFVGFHEAEQKTLAVLPGYQKIGLNTIVKHMKDFIQETVDKGERLLDKGDVTTADVGLAEGLLTKGEGDDVLLEEGVSGPSESEIEDETSVGVGSGWAQASHLGVWSRAWRRANSRRTRPSSRAGARTRGWARRLVEGVVSDESDESDVVRDVLADSAAKEASSIAAASVAIAAAMASNEANLREFSACFKQWAKCP